MTHKECLVKMTLIWGHMALHPKSTKASTYEKMFMKPDLRLCPCCEYAGLPTLDEDTDCNKCPLKEFWYRTSNYRVPEKVPPYVTPCLFPGTPYQGWTTAQSVKERAECARQIEAAATAEFVKHYTSTKEND